MKKIVILGLACLLAAGTAWGRSYNLKESEEVSLSGIDTIVIDIDGPRCVVCIRTIDIDTVIQGNERGDRLSLSLDGNVRSNRRRAVPGLITDTRGDELRISLYPRNLTVLGLVSGGTAKFTIRIPAGFQGDVDVRTSSDDLALRDLEVGNLKVKSSSGNISADTVSAGNIDLECSSGAIELEEILAAGDLRLHASSGDILAGDIAAGGTGNIHLSSGSLEGSSIRADELEIDCSSGSIDVERLSAEDTLHIEASSGRIRSEVIQAERIELVNHSGNITVDELSGEVKIKSSSGDVALGLGEVRGDIDIDCSSGSIRLSVPKGSGFSVDLSSSSGRIAVEEPVLGRVDSKRDGVAGDVNGGGPLFSLHTSSGNISVTSD